jgi:hypothetical protein
MSESDYYDGISMGQFRSQETQFNFSLIAQYVKGVDRSKSFRHLEAAQGAAISLVCSREEQIMSVVMSFRTATIHSMPIFSPRFSFMQVTSLLSVISLPVGYVLVSLAYSKTSVVRLRLERKPFAWESSVELLFYYCIASASHQSQIVL